MNRTYKQALQAGYVKPIRSKPYLNYVGSLPCVVCGCEPAGEAHHVIDSGIGGGMGTKASDIFVFPLCRIHHTWLHDDVDKFEEKFGDQWMWVCLTIHQAITEGVLTL
jgi:hypothetical protein